MNEWCQIYVLYRSSLRSSFSNLVFGGKLLPEKESISKLKPFFSIQRRFVTVVMATCLRYVTRHATKCWTSEIWEHLQKISLFIEALIGTLLWTSALLFTVVAFQAGYGLNGRVLIRDVICLTPEWFFPRVFSPNRKSVNSYHCNAWKKPKTFVFSLYFIYYWLVAPFFSFWKWID